MMIFLKKTTIPPICLLGTTFFWVFAQIKTKGYLEAANLIKNSAVVLSFCFIFENIIRAIFPSCTKVCVLVHFSLGLCQHVVYAVTYLIKDDLFRDYWQPIYFGYYMWTITLLVARPNVFFGKFYTFYTIHHTFSFIITGSWVLITCCPWEPYIYRGVLLWLSSDVYLYGINTYRSLSPGIDRTDFRSLQMKAFVLERIHRSSAYIQAFILTDGKLSPLAWTVFGTGILNDIVDIYFQLQSICRSRGINKSEGLKDADRAGKKLVNYNDKEYDSKIGAPLAEETTNSEYIVVDA